MQIDLPFAILLFLAATVGIAIAGPRKTMFHIHPISILLLVLYVLGTRLIAISRNRPMWQPRLTKDTIRDVPNQQNLAQLSLPRVVILFAVLALVVGAAGYIVAQAGIAIAQETGLSESLVGALFTAIATSLPELIVPIAAVRQKALTLAVSNIIGGNTFDILFVAFADMAYFKGSILHAVTTNQVYLIGLTMLMTSILILGLLYREKQGIAKIGWESVLIMAVYLAGNAFLFFG